MNTNALIDIILAMLGFIAFGHQCVMHTTKEKVVDFGPIQVTADKTKTLPLSPIGGGITIVGGIVLLVMSS